MVRRYDVAAALSSPRPRLMLRRPAALVCLLFGAIGCHDGVTGPLSGLATSLSYVAEPPGVVVVVPSIVGARDSVVATLSVNQSGCYDVRADAGLVRGTLVITVSESELNRRCVDAAIATIARVTVRQLRPGEYRTVVNYRRVPLSGSAQTRTLLQADLSLR